MTTFEITIIVLVAVIALFLLAIVCQFGVFLSRDDGTVWKREYWQHYRIQAAIAAMNIVNGAYNVHNDMERLVRHSVKLADALIAELQMKGGQDD